MVLTGSNPDQCHLGELLRNHPPSHLVGNHCTASLPETCKRLSIIEYLQDMRSIVNSLVAAQSRVDDDGLIAYVLNQQGDDYASIYNSYYCSCLESMNHCTYGNLYRNIIEIGLSLLHRASLPIKFRTYSVLFKLLSFS